MNGALYDRIGTGYATRRRSDPRISVQIDAALGRCQSVLNVGAGAGSYEPENRLVVAVEPSAEMIRQRPGAAAQAVQTSAERLPFQDQSFDAALAVLTAHHWERRDEGLAEMRRVARERVVIFTWDPEHPGFWLVQRYFPEILEMDRTTFPSLFEIERAIGPAIADPVPVPFDCSDGFWAPIGSAQRVTLTHMCAVQYRRSQSSTQQRALLGCGETSRTGRGLKSMVAYKSCRNWTLGIA